MRMYTSVVVTLPLVLLSLLASVAVANLEEADKEVILNAINRFRGKVDPIATNMNEVEWNDELSYMAQFWAAQCENTENENRNDQTTQFDSVGEIFAATANYSVDFAALVSTWYEEGLFYDYYNGICLDEDGEENDKEEACAKYKQLVWAQTTAVGCGSFRCNEIERLDDENIEGVAEFFVCYLGPSFSNYGEPPYQTGSEPCSACSYDRPTCVNNLCSLDSGAVGTLSSVVFISALATMLLFLTS